MAGKPDLSKPWRDAFAAEWTRSLKERLAGMTEEESIEFMRWFVGDDEARVLARKMALRGLTRARA